MERRLGREEVMTIGVLFERGMSKRGIARQLGVDEKAVRYRLQRLAQRARDGRADQVSSVAPYARAIAHWMATRGERGVSGRVLSEWLASEHGYTGSYKAVQRFVRAHYPKPRLRVRRRIETPPGAQAQADWAEYPGVVIGGERVDLSAFHLALSHSRYEAVVWSLRQDELAWLSVHNAALTRLGGVPAVIRIDNPKTAIAKGAGPWGELNERYAAYARALRFHVDAVRPRAPEEKGKVERRVLAQRAGFDPYGEDWRDLTALQTRSDDFVRASAERRICPATGFSVWESYQAERPLLTPLPELLPEPFDRVAQRGVSRDALVSFEGHSYSVPFRFADQSVEVRGCAATVQVWAEGQIVAEHPRRTRQRLVIDPRHYEGESTPRVFAPTPLGRMGRRMQEIWAMAPERRPLDLYAALAEVAR
jgi:transposase